MTADPELQRLMDERKHLRIKLSRAQDSGIRDRTAIERLRRKLELVDGSIADRLREEKSAPG